MFLADLNELPSQTKQLNAVARKRLKFEANVLARSSVPSDSCSEDRNFPLALFIENKDACIEPLLASTPKSPSSVSPPLTTICDPQTNNTELCVSMSAVEQLVTASVRKQLQPLHDRIHVLEQLVSTPVTETDLQQIQLRVTQLERDLLSRDTELAFQKTEIDRLKKTKISNPA